MPYNRYQQPTALPDSPSKGSSANCIPKVLQALKNKAAKALHCSHLVAQHRLPAQENDVPPPVGTFHDVMSKNG